MYTFRLKFSFALRFLLSEDAARSEFPPNKIHYRRIVYTVDDESIVVMILRVRRKEDIDYSNL